MDKIITKKSFCLLLLGLFFISPMLLALEPLNTILPWKVTAFMERLYSFGNQGGEIIWVILLVPLGFILIGGVLMFSTLKLFSNVVDWLISKATNSKL